MRPIIVKKENAERIMVEFDKVQGNATERIIESYEQLIEIINDINHRLYGISKTALQGTEVEYTFAQVFPRAYKWTPKSTHFVLRYSRGTWRITSINRLTCPNRDNRGYPYNLFLTNEGKLAVLRMYM